MRIVEDALSKMRRKHRLYRSDRIFIHEAKKYVYIYVPYRIEMRIEKEDCKKICDEIVSILAQRLGLSVVYP